jgi:Domain of unknown function (DUF4349)
MIRAILLAAVASATLAACSPYPTLFSPSASQDERAGRGGGAGDRMMAQLAAGQQPSQQQPPARHIAVTRSFTLRLPANDVATVLQRHLGECAKLECTVLESNLHQVSEGRVSARASVRIAPDRYATLAAIITAPPVEVTTQSERAEDRTIAVLDIEKRLDAKMALRDRLAALLKDPNAKTVADLLAIEKELAQVQSDIESAIAQRDYLRTITDTVRVDIAYDGRTAVVAGHDFSPLRRAIDGMIQTFITSVAALITFLAGAAPWLPVIALLVWGIRRTFRRWRAQRTAAAKAS